MQRRYFLLACSLLLLGLSGCGSSNGGQNQIPLPPSFSESRFQPNYGGDMASVNYWTQPTITYRFVTPANAKDIRLNPISAVTPTAAQQDAVREAIAKWQAALAANDAPGRRTFVEISGDTFADIDIVLQTKSQFQNGFLTEEFGHTDYFWSDLDAGILGRSVVRLRNDLSSRDFRYNALHEFGHAIGLDGHSRRVGTVMHAYEVTIVLPVDLTSYDINTIRADYTR